MVDYADSGFQLITREIYSVYNNMYIGGPQTHEAVKTQTA